MYPRSTRCLLLALHIYPGEPVSKARVIYPPLHHNGKGYIYIAIDLYDIL